MGLLEISNLTTEIRGKSERTIAVDDVSFSIQKGETVGIVGESGCGKSSLSLSIMQLLPVGGTICEGSSIRLDGQELVGCPDKQMRRIRGSRIAMVFQDPMTSLNPTMTIGNQIMEAVRYHTGKPVHECRERVVDGLGMVGMPHPRERLDYYPHQLSGGLRQRVMIALAISCEPQVLIADEPTTALDVTTECKILDVLGKLKDEIGMSLILISHDLALVAERTETIYVMYGGRLAETASAATIFHDVRHPYTKALLASMPSGSRRHVGDLVNIPGRPPTQAHSLEACLFAPRCPRATEMCTRLRPEVTVTGQRHTVACFHPLEMEDAASAPGRQTLSGTPGAPDLLQAVTVEGNEVIQVCQLSKSYAMSRGAFGPRTGVVSAVDDVTLSVLRGETLGLMGESGCGKSTFMRMLVGLEKASSGSVLVGGDDVAEAFKWSRYGRQVRKKLSRTLQLMFQDPYSSLDPRMSVRDILREPLIAQHIGNRREQDDRITRGLEEVGLPPFAGNLYPHEFSGGQRQRIGLARALVVRPQILVVDEPTSALDVSVQAQVLNLMCKLQSTYQLTYVIVSHDQRIIRYMSDRVAVMYLGRLVELGPAEDVFNAPAHPYTAGLIQAGARMGAENRKDNTFDIRGEIPSAINPPSGCRYHTRCPIAKGICSSERPALREIRPGHLVECHFPVSSNLPALYRQRNALRTITPESNATSGCDFGGQEQAAGSLVSGKSIK